MGHTYILVRGANHKVKKFISELSAKYLPTIIHTKDMKKPAMKYVQVGARPIQLWEIVYPNECKDLMWNTLFAYPGAATQESFKHNGFAEHQKKYKKFIWPLRKILGVKPIPKRWDDKAGFMPLDQFGVQRIAIGYKDDEVYDNGAEQI